MNRTVTASGSPQDDAPDAAPLRRLQRLPWLDFFRGLAVLIMIETHVVNTFLSSGLRAEGWFPLLNYVNGLVAPSFLFIAGFVQGMERRNASGKPINYARRAWRLLGICVLGYAMHFPIGPVLEHRWADALRIGTQVDVLQCLAMGLGLLLGWSWLVEKYGGKMRGTLAWSLGVAALAIVVILGAPTAQVWTGGPQAVRAWVNASTGSLFPVFPWIGFVFLGALMGAWPRRPAPERAAGIIGLFVVAWACRGTDFSAVSPSFFLERAVWVLALAAVCEWSAGRPLPAVVTYAGKHSLKFYVVHLALITTLAGAGIPAVSFPWPHTLALLAGVGAVSFGAAWFFAWLPPFRRPVRPSAASPVVAREEVPSVAA